MNIVKRAAAIAAIACAVPLAGAVAPSTAKAATFPTQCKYPVATYARPGNFFTVYHETLNAEVCFNGQSVWAPWTNHRFSAVPGWNGTELGRGTFYDPNRYGGSLTVWSNDRDSVGFGPVTFNEDTFLRIWVTRTGQVYTYAGR
ncbi:MAG: hypothetical protein QOE06_373 [Thermoleophilaceae bacterium]|nr:hypothetical protein [Thermoleophilaceae bacterium]